MIHKLVTGFLSLSLLVVAPMAVRDHQWIHTSPNFTQLRQATKVLIVEDMGNGSGVMIEKNRMLTAGHVAAMDSDTTPLTLNGKRVKVLKIDREVDIALLEVDQDCPCVPIGPLPKHLDDSVVLVGYPAYPTLQSQILTEGRVTGMLPDKQHLITTANAAPGNSGGGLFYKDSNGNWKLGGILVAIAGHGNMFGEPTLFTYISISVDSETIQKFLK